MIEAIRRLFSATANREDAPADRDYTLRLATAALLVEVARADFDEDSQEQATIRRLLQERFELSDDHTAALFEAASERADTAVSLHGFTRVLHEHLNDGEKLEVIALLWKVALADAALDKHEDHLVRKVAGLLYVPHRDLVRLKHQAMAEMGIGK